MPQEMSIPGFSGEASHFSNNTDQFGFDAELHRSGHNKAPQLHFHDFYEFNIYLGKEPARYRLLDKEYEVNFGDIVRRDIFRRGKDHRKALGMIIQQHRCVAFNMLSLQQITNLQFSLSEIIRIRKCINAKRRTIHIAIQPGNHYIVILGIQRYNIPLFNLRTIICFRLPVQHFAIRHPIENIFLGGHSIHICAPLHNENRTKNLVRFHYTIIDYFIAF